METMRTIPQNYTGVAIGNRTKKERLASVHNLKRRINFLKKIPIFNGLTNEHCIELLNISDEKTFPQYEVIVKQGDKSDALFILKKGCVKLYCNESLLTDISAIDIFGEVGFLSGAPHLISVITTTESAVIEINRTKFLNLFRNDNVNRSVILLNIINEIAQHPQKYKGITNCK